MNTLKYVLAFIAIQVIALALAIVGLPICAYLAAYGAWRTERPTSAGLRHFPSWAWLWDNAEDGVCPAWYLRGHLPWSLARTAFSWTALRNPVNNFRYVKRLLWLPYPVSLKGRPLWRWTWGTKPGGFYAQAGWNSSGFPVLSAGRNVNPF